MKTGKVMIFGIGVVVFLAAAGYAVSLIIENFEQLAEEGIQFEKTVGYVRLDGLTVPVSVKGKLRYYLFVDARIEIADDSRLLEVQGKLPGIRDAVLRDFHKTSVAGDSPVVAIDIRNMKDRMAKIANRIVGDNLVTTVYVTKLLRAHG